MPSSLSQKSISIVKATVPALETHGLEIVRTMYARMFEDPAIRDLFNQSHHGETGSQPKALTGAILAYAQNIDNLNALSEAVERISQKHVGLQILPEHYPAVATALLAAIKDVLGDVATDEVLSAWGEAYWFLADILIAREQTIYAELDKKEGGWSGWREFRVLDKRRESEIITSFVLEPVDGKPVIRHKPGQYLTFWFDLPGRQSLKRNYSISASPNGRTYRITVKREPEGTVSNWLHDQVGVGATLRSAPPAGDFFLDMTARRPLLLLSGGVGLTPMMSMLETLVSERVSVPIHFVHGSLNGGTHAMGEHLRKLVADCTNIDAKVFYLHPRAADRLGVDYDVAGSITMDWLSANIPLTEAEIYLCGPKPFLRTFVCGLRNAGVAPACIHYEFFGPADELLAA